MSLSFTRSGPSFPKSFIIYPDLPTYTHSCWVILDFEYKRKQNKTPKPAAICPNSQRQLCILAWRCWTSATNRCTLFLSFIKWQDACACLFVYVYRHLPGERNQNLSHSSKDSKCTLSSDWLMGCWSSMQVPKCHWTAETSSPSYLFEAQINIPYQLQWKAGECHNLNG